MRAGRRLLLVALLGIAACSGDGTEQLSTEPGENGAPSEAALAARERLDDPVDGYEDCGTIAADSGWPTTIVRPADRCLLVALESGTAAALTLTGRDGAGAAVLTRYLVVGAGSLEVHRTTIARDGTVTEAVATCTAPPAMWILDIGGSCPSG